MIHPTRRFVLTAAAALAVPAPASASSNPTRVTALIRDFAGGAAVTQGKIALDLPILVENGNAVSMGITIDAPPGAVREVAVFAEGANQSCGIKRRRSMTLLAG
jgi:sulfur-oxidizing protein SoxY